LAGDSGAAALGRVAVRWGSRLRLWRDLHPDWDVAAVGQVSRRGP